MYQGVDFISGLGLLRRDTMFRMAVGQSDELDEELAAEAILAQCKQALNGETPQAGLLLASHDLELEDFVRIIMDAYPDIDLIGGTTIAPMSSAAGYEESSTVLTLFASDEVDFTTGSAGGVAENVGKAVSDAIAEATGKTSKEVVLCITTPSVEGLDPVAVTDALGDALPAGTIIFGGGATPDLPMAPPWLGGVQIHGREVTTDSMPVLLVSGPLKVSVGISHGWKMVGKPAKITRAEGNMVFEINDEPVKSFYDHYLGENVDAALANPLAILDPETGRRFLRAPMMFTDLGAAAFLGSVPQGAEAQIAMATTDDILGGAESSVEDALSRFPESFKPQAALVSSCAVRNILLGTRTGSELDRIRATLGQDVPVSGFYAYGEIAPLDNHTRPQFHNETCCTVLMGT